MAETLGVAEAKRRFAELIERVANGERIIVSRHGKPVVALVRPQDAPAAAIEEYTGYAPIAGFLSDWTEDDIDEMVTRLYADRRRAKDRPAPTFE